jgi:hypothetical protein
MLNFITTMHHYLRFLAANRKEYLNFSKQLFVAEIAGFIAGIAVAELFASHSSMTTTMINYNNNNNSDNFIISASSSAADYLVSLTAFFIIFYRDNSSLYYKGHKKNNGSRHHHHRHYTFYRLRKVFGMALRLWPSIAVADIAFIITRPYFQYAFLQTGFEPGISAMLAHFVAFSIFNIVAMFSRSIIEFEKLRRKERNDNNITDRKEEI